VLCDEPRALERALAHERADPERATLAPDRPELRREAVEIDEQARPREPEVEQRHEALAAGERLGVVAEERERLVDRPRRDVVERRRLQRSSFTTTTRGRRSSARRSSTASTGSA